MKAGPTASKIPWRTTESRPLWWSRGIILGVLTFSLIILLHASFQCAWSESWGRQWYFASSDRAGMRIPSFPEAERYLLGVGKADVTGPVVEVNMMGYADPKQVGTGLRQRLYSRAFIVADIRKPAERFVYLVLDVHCGDTAIRYGILEGLAAMGKDYSIYTHQNVAVTGTHSHSGPGAWLNYLLPQISSRGFDKQSYKAIVDGAILSIQRAHRSVQPGYLIAGQTIVKGGNINRSLYAYLANPEKERKLYNISVDDDGSVEKVMTMLKFQRASDGKNIGVLTWFPVHGTSMLGNNTLISGDNKGVAADLFEKSVHTDRDTVPGFVAGFSQANVGDTSPNVLGAWCEDGSGQQCSFENSTCADGKCQACQGRGPFFRVEDKGASSCYEIGRRQFQAARNLYESLKIKGMTIEGHSVKSFHKFHDMKNYTFPLENGTFVQTCSAALGYSFAAGTSDGPGVFDFTQNGPEEPNASPVWGIVSRFLKEPSERQKQCHYPKPILLDVGEITRPYLWTPNIVDIQVFRVGQFYIIVSPGEATTMAGRRWKSAIHESATALSLSDTSADPIVVIGGPANTYTHYISTPEEYSIQRYEGASTLYGQYTLNAYINISVSYLSYLSASSINTSPDSGPLPPDNSRKSLSFIPGVIYDGTPLFKSFGDVKSDANLVYRIGEAVHVTFVGANPRNNLRLEGTYAAVEKFDMWTRRWKVVRDDSDWSLVFNWKKTNEILMTSEVEIVWETEMYAESGEYRIRYFGDSKAIGGKITPFQGTSRPFVLTWRKGVGNLKKTLSLSPGHKSGFAINAG